MQRNRGKQQNGKNQIYPSECRVPENSKAIVIKKAFLNEQCKEIEGNNRMENTRDHFNKIGEIKEIFHERMGKIKDRNDKYLTEAEEIKKRWQEYREEVY